MQHENASLKEQIEALNKEMEITKEKLHTVEQAWEQAVKLGKYIVHYGSFVVIRTMQFYLLISANLF